MTFEEWFEKWWSERTDGPYKSINVESIARAAWEAAQAQEKGVIGEIKEMWAEHPSLRDEFAMAALGGILSHHCVTASGIPLVARDAYQIADVMLKEREK